MKQETIQQIQDFRSLTSSVSFTIQDIEFLKGEIKKLEDQKSIMQENLLIQERKEKEEKEQLSKLIDEINESLKYEIKNISDITENTSKFELRGFSSEVEQKELMQLFDIERIAYEEYNRIISGYGLEKIEIPKRNFIYKPQELQAETLQKSI